MKKLTLAVALVAFASMAYAQGTHPSPGHGAAGNPNNASDVPLPKSNLKRSSSATIKHYHFSGTHPSPGHGAAGNPNE